MKQRKSTKRIIIHCSATRPDWLAGQRLDSKVKEIRRWHVEGNGWSDIGYHRLIDQDGTVREGRAQNVQGAHTKGQNADSYAICLIGGHGSSEHDNPEDHFTEAQLQSLVKQVERLKLKYPEIDTIHGHNEFSSKACPGFNVKKHWERLAYLYGENTQEKPKHSGRSSISKSSTVRSSAVAMASAAGTGVTAISSLDGYVQLAFVGFAGIILLSLLWIMRERIKKWNAGDR